MSCEVIKTVSKLYSGGYGKKSKSIAVIGGYNMVFDDMNYYINLKELMYARLKMNGNKNGIDDHFRTFIGMSKKNAILEIMKNMTIQETLLQAIKKTSQHVCHLCSAIVDATFNNLGSAGMALPNVNEVCYDSADVDSIYNTLKSFHTFYKILNISSIIGQTNSMTPPPKPTELSEMFGKEMPITLPTTSEDMDHFQQLIVDAAVEAKKIEKYSCEAMVWLAVFIDNIDIIMVALTQKIKETQ
jgi:hypothetical protein